jgi:hypothetical protein
MKRLVIAMMLAAAALAPGMPVRAAGDRVVTVTLVRWPYT